MILPFRMALIVCFSVTWMISWPSTPASSASLDISASAPRVIWMKPPGAANALTPSVSSTMNVNDKLGRVLAWASKVPTRRHVPVDGLVLHHAVAQPDLLADRLAELEFVLVGDLELAKLLRPLEDRAELRSRPRPGRLRTERPGCRTRLAATATTIRDASWLSHFPARAPLAEGHALLRLRSLPTHRSPRRWRRARSCLSRRLCPRVSYHIALLGEPGSPH